MYSWKAKGETIPFPPLCYMGDITAMIRTVLADDEKKVVYLLQKLIDWERLGYEIVGIAHDGISALELVEKQDAQLLITDIRMPGYDGIELIRRVKENSPGTHIIIISGYREFEYAQSALKYGVEDYLLKPLKKDELTSILMRVTEKQDEEVRQEYRQKKDVEKMQELMTAQLRRSAYRDVPFPGKERLNDEFGFGFADGIFYTAIVKPDIPEGWKHPEGFRLVLQHALEIMRKELGDIASEYAVSVFQEGIIAVINCTEFNGVEVKQCFTKIRREIEKQRDLFWDIKAFVAIGSRKQRTEELPGSFLDAVWLCKDRLCRQQVWRDADAEQPEYDRRYEIDEGARRRIREAAEYLDEELFKQELEDSFSDLMQSDGLNGQMAEDWFRQVTVTSISGMERGQNIERTFTERIYELIWYCASLQEVYALLEQMICRKILQIREEKEEKESRPITEAKRYIQAHFQEELKLEDVSSHVGFNTTYFSSLFKKETGKNFSDYVTELRINKAKELLYSDELTIHDICEQVGYRDLKYFSRLFKKATGTSPSEYRKLYR